MISLQMGVIPSLDILKKLSDINKRKNCSEKIKKYLNAELPESEMLVDWSKARRDYDLIHGLIIMIICPYGKSVMHRMSII